MAESARGISQKGLCGQEAQVRTRAAWGWTPWTPFLPQVCKRGAPRAPSDLFSFPLQPSTTQQRKSCSVLSDGVVNADSVIARSVGFTATSPALNGSQPSRADRTLQAFLRAVVRSTDSEPWGLGLSSAL